ncbi:MAG: restriction endonuclease [Deltaproteobacteria bacterium]|nr:restriction endonuclease [Deltaproteobacteria bacterium]
MARYSAAKIQEMLEESDNAATADEKGDKLEILIRYIFDKVPGVTFYQKNILDRNRTHELDLAFWNLQSQSAICFLDPVIIVECKNTAQPLGGTGVGWFVRKLQDRGISYGILVSLSGITGQADGHSNAHSEVLSALTRDGIKILLIDRQELLSLANTDDLVELLKTKILRLTLYKAIN